MTISIWDFIQKQLLGMQWLNVLVGRLLTAIGFDTANRWVGSLQFFIYDVIKITLLLCVLIFFISYIVYYFYIEFKNRGGALRLSPKQMLEVL